MLLQSPSKSSQRKANGGLKDVEFDSTESELRAQRLKWFFIAAGDPKPFTLFYNDSLWPKSILHRERLSLKSGRVVTFKTTKNGTFQALFIGKVKKTYEDEACDRVIQKMKKNPEEPVANLGEIQWVLFLSSLRNRVLSFIIV